MGKDYYKTLDISKDADEKAIKSAYRKMANKWHPDKNLDNVEVATQKFKEISEAYQILSDPKKRETYDRHGSDAFDENGLDETDLFKKFEKMFGGGENDVPPVEVPLEATLEELYSGATKSVQYERFNLCDKCDGTGTKNGKDGMCKSCEGNGTISVKTPFGYAKVPCSICRGNGMDPKAERCKKCSGNRCYKEKKTLEVTIPKGAIHKYPIVVQDEGNAIPEDEIRSDITRSDVVFIIDQLPHDTFKRGIVIQELDLISREALTIEVNLTFLESLFGFEKVITHLDGHKVLFSSTHPVRHTDVFVIKNEGMTILDDTNRGDLFIRVNVEAPPKVEGKSRKALWEVLTGNKNVPSVKSSSLDIINFDKYKLDLGKDKSQADMRNKYRNRRRHTSEGESMEGKSTECKMQ